TTTYVVFGIWAPKGIPQEVVDTMGKVWDNNIAKSDRLMKYAESKAQAVKVEWGDAAAATGLGATQVMAWGLYAGGKAKNKPDTVGIPPLK
ncbi:MAG: hypothetical protein MI741_06300, partial [Rhodospirillales bacterium]|nr:hypothetical protein [Rhodospirillales bacterium]